MPSALTAELQECDTFQFMVWNTGSGDINIFVRKGHYNDVIMTTIASQITSLAVVYSTAYLDADQRKHQSSASLAFVWGIHRSRWIPAQKASYAENVSIWWRHHVNICNANRVRATALIFNCEQLFLKRSKAYEVANSTPLMGLEPMTHTNVARVLLVIAHILPTVIRF